MGIKRRQGRWLLLTFFGLVAATALTAANAFDAFKPLPLTPDIPADNPQSPPKIALGKQLYFDPRLSVNGAVTCNSCHDLMAGGDDGRALSIGALGKPGIRSAPTLWNVAFETIYFWDGRATSLEAAIREQLFDGTVMAMPSGKVLVKRLAEIPEYKREFHEVFGKSAPVSVDNVTKALASYIRTLVTRNNAFDRYLQGDKHAMSKTAVRGFHEFVDEGCGACHFWVNMSGPVPGLAFKMGEGFYELFPNYPDSQYDKQYDLLKDLGRFNVTKNVRHKHMFRVPSLRNVALTAPYFHNGSVKTLDEAVRVMAKTQFQKHLTDQQVKDIVAFLKDLTGKFPEQLMPRLPTTPGFSVLDQGNSLPPRPEVNR